MKTEIEKSGHRVIIPHFPHTDAPNLDEWLKHMEKYDESIDEQTIFVGHSLGGLFALRFLEKRTTPIRATFLVACVTSPSDGLDFAPLMTTFTTPPFDFATIKKNGGSMHMLHGDNDPYISVNHAEQMATNIKATLELIKGGAHLNISAGFAQFPLLRDKILSTTQ